MIVKNSTEIFKCHYTNASRFDRLSVWSVGIGVMTVLALTPHTGNTYPFLCFGLLYMLIPFWFEFMVHMIRTKSYIELIDNKIVFKRWMCRKVSYPINKIERIQVVDFDTDVVDKLTQDYRLPLSMGMVDVYPRKGVIVFFERKWIKSVQPILFNPIDSELFAYSLAVKSGKTYLLEPR